jgi:hypothetical protein
MDAHLLDPMTGGILVSLTFASPPSNAQTALTHGLAMVRARQQLNPLGGNAWTVPLAPTAMKPHPVYSLGLDDLAAGKGLEAAKPVAWRYLLIENNQVRQAAEVLADASGGAATFGSVSCGHIAGLEQAFTLIEQIADVQQWPYEVRALRVPALYVMALWLHDTDPAGAADHFVPLPPAFAPLRAGQDYVAADFLILLQDMAKKKAPLDRRVAPA